MGVIAPDHKKKKSDGNTFGFFVFLFCVVGIPFFAIKSCASSTTSSKSENKYTYIEENDSVSASVYRKDTKGLYELAGPVMDTAGILSKSEYAELDDYLRKLDRNSGVQIVVLTVESLDGESIEEFSINHAEKWQLGYKGVDNGALLTVAMAEHDVRIETGYGTEGSLTDAKCARIIRNVIIPSFKNGDYGEGIIEAVKNMAGCITEDEGLLSPSVNGTEDVEGEEVEAGPLLFMLVLFLLLFILPAVTGFRRRGFVFVPFGMESHHHSGGFSSGSGSHFSGGGGHFGGGGASGHW